MAFTCSHSPHPARTVGSTLSISLWPWPHPDSLEIVLSQFYIFYIILGFPWSSLAHFLDQQPQPPTPPPRCCPHLSPPSPVKAPGKTSSRKQEARSKDTHQGCERLILLSHLQVITVFDLGNASPADISQSCSPGACFAPTQLRGGGKGGVISEEGSGERLWIQLPMETASVGAGWRGCLATLGQVKTFCRP